MKKIINVFALLLLTGMIAAGFVSCSNASGGGSGSGDGGTNKKILVVYASKTDKVTVYEDHTWESIYVPDGKCYNKGTWECLTGDFDNGTATIHVTYSISNHVSTGDYGVNIENGEFWFFFNRYKKQ